MLNRRYEGLSAEPVPGGSWGAELEEAVGEAGREEMERQIRGQEVGSGLEQNICQWPERGGRQQDFQVTAGTPAVTLRCMTAAQQS